MKKFVSFVIGYIASFMTISAQSVDGTVARHDYVDLGLPSGNKWATYNVGAKTPTGYGDFYAWGETKTKKSFLIKDYKWAKGEHYDVFTKYNKKDGKKVLEGKDDAAFANWGKSWCMPTKEDILELMEYCTWEIVRNFNNSGVDGALGTSKTNGHTIFLPGGGRWMTGKPAKGSGLGAVCYWTSTLNGGSTSGGGVYYGVSKRLDGTSELFWEGTDRRIGCLCRGVVAK
ncbi:MAG: hypothetical protein IKV67_06755 [Paludibacteraceae bacterium]|nr:hypothetical protein [Paludibacteraceae bacterium]